MKDLSLFNSTESNLVTIRQFAEVYGVSYDTVNNAVKRLFPEIVRNGKTTYLNEMQVAAISKELKSNAKVTEQLTFEAGSKVKNTTTELEVIANYKAATEALVSMLNAKNQALQAENERQKQQLAIQQPKVDVYNHLVERKFHKCLRDTAQYVGVKERHFFAVLQEKKIIYKHAGHYRAYSKYADCFDLLANVCRDKEVRQQLVVNVKGLELVQKIFAKDGKKN